MDYFDLPALSASRLSLFMRSRPAFIQSIYGGRDDTQTPAMRLGTLTHMATLEPFLYAEEVVVWDGQRRGKAWEAFEDDHRHRTIATASEDSAALAMASAVCSDPLASAYLAECPLREVVLHKNLKVDGMRIPCKAKVDALGEGVVADLKTTTDPNPHEFARSVARYRYWVQAWWYMMMTGRDRFVFIAVNSSSPHEVVTHEIVKDDPVWTMADELCTRALGDLVRCYRTGDWRLPASKTTHPVEIPPWYWRSQGIIG